MFRIHKTKLLLLIIIAQVLCSASYFAAQSEQTRAIVVPASAVLAVIAAVVSLSYFSSWTVLAVRFGLKSPCTITNANLSRTLAGLCLIGVGICNAQFAVAFAPPNSLRIWLIAFAIQVLGAFILLRVVTMKKRHRQDNDQSRADTEVNARTDQETAWRLFLNAVTGTAFHHAPATLRFLDKNKGMVLIACYLILWHWVCTTPNNLCGALFLICLFAVVVAPVLFALVAMAAALCHILGKIRSRQLIVYLAIISVGLYLCGWATTLLCAANAFDQEVAPFGSLFAFMAFGLKGAGLLLVFSSAGLAGRLLGLTEEQGGAPRSVSSSFVQSSRSSTDPVSEAERKRLRITRSLKS